MHMLYILRYDDAYTSHAPCALKTQAGAHKSAPEDAAREDDDDGDDNDDDDVGDNFAGLFVWGAKSAPASN